MAATLGHTNPEIFPEPYQSKPERWVENPKLGKTSTSGLSQNGKCYNELEMRYWLVDIFSFNQVPNLRRDHACV